MFILKPLHYTVIRVAPLQRKTPVVSTTFVSILQRGHPVRHDKYPADVRPSSHVWKYVVGYCSHSLLIAGFQLLKIVVFDLVDEVTYHLYHTVPGRWIGRGTRSAYSLRSPDNLIEFFIDGVM
jgi:hypothetical protein